VRGSYDGKIPAGGLETIGSGGTNPGEKGFSSVESNNFIRRYFKYIIRIRYVSLRSGGVVGMHSKNTKMKTEVIMRLEAEEVIEKEVKKYGTGAVVYVPRSWIGEKVKVLRLGKKND